MDVIKIVLAVFVLAASAIAQTYEIDWYVIGSGGGHSESSSYSIDGTIGQPIIGVSSSASYTVESGFWVGAGVSAGYEYLLGDVNMYAGAWPPAAIGADVTYLVNFFRGLPSSHSCLLGGFWCSADANGDCNIISSDVTKLVNFFRGLTSLDHCADYEPAWHNTSELPPEEPSGWPNCGSSFVTAKSSTDVSESK